MEINGTGAKKIFGWRRFDVAIMIGRWGAVVGSAK